LFAQRIDADGALRWGDSTSAIAIGPELNEYQQPAVVSDDSGGVIVAWTDHRDGFAAPGNIYAQRIDTIGRIRWSEDGILLCSRPRSQWIYANPAIVSDGQGGAIVAWGDSRGSCGIQFHSCQIFAQRITRAGTAAWAPNGVLMSGADDTLSDYTIEADEAGGATVAWTRWVDDRRANQIWAQRVASDGSLRWNETGRMIAATSPSRRLPQMLSDGFSGTIIAWESNDQPANVAGGSVEAQHISPASQLFSALSSSSILAAPNPTRGDAMLRLALSRPGPGTVAIHDLVGRRVRLVFEGELQGGDHSIAWDGRDDAGNRVRPGVYFARVTHPGTRAVGRIVLLP
jgi:hypothetical protein